MKKETDMNEVFVLYDNSSRIPLGTYASLEDAYKALDWFLQHSSGGYHYYVLKSKVD